MLVAELLAQLEQALAEEERIAIAANEANPAPWRPGSEVSPYDDQDVVDAAGNRLALCPDCPAGGVLSEATAKYIARQYPKRTLDMIAAHRRILADYVIVSAIKDAAWAKMCEGGLLSDREANECGRAELAQTTLWSVLEYIAQGYGIETD